jgi:hypothetical protein
MLVVNWLLATKVEYVYYMDSTIAGIVNARSYLLAKKVEYVYYMDSTIAGSMNVSS